MPDKPVNAVTPDTASSQSSSASSTSSNTHEVSGAAQQVAEKSVATTKMAAATTNVSVNNAGSTVKNPVTIKNEAIAAKKAAAKKAAAARKAAAKKAAAAKAATATSTSSTSSASTTDYTKSASDTSKSGSNKGTFKLSFYDPASMGSSMGYGGVAANLSVFPKGTRLKITLSDGTVWYRVVNDTGGFAAANPRQLDVAMPNSQIPSAGILYANVQVLN